MSVIGTYSHFLYNKEIHQRDEKYPKCFVTGCKGGGYLFWRKSGCESRNRERKISRRRNFRVEAMWPDLSKKPSKIELEIINDSEQLDRILVLAQQNSQPILIDWMAAWCRKCIYLKPKLEKLAAEFDTKVKFYYVDVNKVPQSLVKRGNISKMPTMQLWKDGELKDEVIGGHQPWLVIEEVREMIQKYI